jgi:hypothetical protein
MLTDLQCWDFMTRADFEFSVGIKPNNWEVKELLPEEERRGTVYHDTNSEYAPSVHYRSSTYGGGHNY